ncbi:MAG: MarR family transcriptional regulator [Actinomycetota bacterium]
MPSDTAQKDEISEQRIAAWRALLSAHAAQVARLTVAFAEADLPPLSWYDVLRALDDAPQHAMRPRDLGCGVTISRSGMTRLLDRIEDAGLVERRACDTDRRGLLVILTEAGERTLREMSPIYEGELGAGFAGAMSDEEAKTLAGLLERIGGEAESDPAGEPAR